MNITGDWSDAFEGMDDFYDPADANTIGEDTEDVQMETMYKRGSGMKGKSFHSSGLGFSDGSMHSSLEECGKESCGAGSGNCKEACGAGSGNCGESCGAGSGKCGEACESLIDQGMDAFGLDFVL